MNFRCNDTSTGYSSSCSCSSILNIGSQGLTVQTPPGCEAAQLECYESCSGSATFRCSSRGNSVEKTCDCTKNDVLNINFTFSQPSQSSSILRVNNPSSSLSSSSDTLNVRQANDLITAIDQSRAQNESDQQIVESEELTLTPIPNLNRTLTPKVVASTSSTSTIIVNEQERMQNRAGQASQQMLNQSKPQQSQQQTVKVIEVSQSPSASNLTVQDRLSRTQGQGTNLWQSASVTSYTEDNDVKVIEVYSNCTTSDCPQQLEQLQPKIIDDILGSVPRAEAVKETDECSKSKKDCEKSCGDKMPLFLCLPLSDRVIKSCSCSNIS
eukprot:TRINITY_DN3431_c1_g1_i10.p1 TRINITY_DN3431_c1_g1~~TRINITY_DN3431_c1_g1_i10.p1  ORF type:complete len:325 (-),score=30.20 TRINITY_DN3431_c1_g1_i10:852-1826(-)